VRKGEAPVPRRLFDAVVTAMGFLSALLIAFMAVSITYQVILRYFFNTSVLWINDFIEYSLLWSTFLGSAFVLREERHIEMDFFLSRLGPRNRILSKVATSVLGCLVCGVICVFALVTVTDNYVRGIRVIKTVEVPKYIVLIPIFIGSLLLTGQFAIRAGGYYARLKEPSETEEEVDYGI
jgi:TRAP-type C4-dicarboxylate transport system permease small subunit